MPGFSSRCHIPSFSSTGTFRAFKIRSGSCLEKRGFAWSRRDSKSREAFTVREAGCGFTRYLSPRPSASRNCHAGAVRNPGSQGQRGNSRGNSVSFFNNCNPYVTTFQTLLYPGAGGAASEGVAGTAGSFVW